MSTLLNENTHAVYANVDGSMVKIPAGRAIDASGKNADALKGISGVRVLTGDEAEAALAASRGPSSDPGLEGSLGNDVAEALARVNSLAVSAPLRVVVGDDQAPYGPGSGVRTTKGEAAKESPEAARHFGPGEALQVGPVEPQEQPFHGVPTHDVVHNDQVAAAEDAERLAREIAGVSESSSDDDAEGDDIDNLKGEELDAAVAEADIEGRSSMSADEKRAALREHRAD